MTINIDKETNKSLGIQYRPLCEKVIRGVLDYEGCPYEIEVSILISDNENIKELNSEYRNINKTTDVLSFPAINFENPSDFKFLKKYKSFFNPETGDLILGDIALNANRVLSQAKEYGHTVRREFAFLVAHSMLHLLGYDHMNDDERLEMEERQREILSNLGINR